MSAKKKTWLTRGITASLGVMAVGFLISLQPSQSIEQTALPAANAALNDCTDINLNDLKDANGKPLFEFVGVRYHMNKWSCVWSTSTGNAGIMLRNNTIHNGGAAFVTRSSLATPGTQTAFGYQAPGWMLSASNRDVAFTVTAHTKAQCEAIAQAAESHW